jgi:adenylate kinase
MTPQVLIFLGRAGSGKGTQAELLVKKFGFSYIGSGELLRELAQKKDFTGLKAGAVMKSGVLVPTTLVFMLWINQMEQIKKEQAEGFKGIIFDGSPRELDEALMLDEALNWYEWNNVKALLIDISRQEALNRLTKRRICAQCGQVIPYIGKYKDIEKCDKCSGDLKERADDTLEAINLRLDLFEKEVVPVIKYYEQKSLLIKINGEQSIEDVQKEILEKIS